MRKTTQNPGGYVTRERKASFKAVFWVFVWAITITVGTSALKRFPESMAPIGVFTLIASTAMGIAGIAAYVRLLKTLDEMQRQMWLITYAISFGILFVAFGSVAILYRAELIHIESQILMALFSAFAGIIIVATYFVCWIKHR